MRSVFALAMAAVVSISGLAACGGSRSASTVVPSTPGQTSQSTQKQVRHLKDTRTLQDVSGGAPPRFMIDLSLFDAPLAGITSSNAQFNAGILGVDAIDKNGDSWQLTGSSTPQVVDLFSLQTTAMALGSGSLPVGTYPSVQLLLDPATTTLTYNGKTYPVVFITSAHPWWDPSQTVEAVSVPLGVTGTAGQSLSLTLDFNVFQSADLRNGIVYLSPTVTGGHGQPTILGTVANAAGGPVSNATVVATDANGNVANVTSTHSNGTFQLHGIDPGTYTVSVLNTFVTKAGATVTASGADAGASPSVTVILGPNTKANIGTLQD
ncbi:MAG: hypothetical protein JWO85_2433 [Candidatus Eremiobacteraeota bacterium]|nr:hypothetical protein [Candidatus Eremiobacteraeota bacterium]